ncbi:MAG: DUF2520 domain-containing protein [Rikenellaceae bacterium]
MKRVVVIGGGNLAEAVALAISQSPAFELAQIYLRSAERGKELSALCSTPFSTFDMPLLEADIYLLAVSDSAIGELSRSLPFAAGAVVAHTAGSTSIEVIDKGLKRAVFYPMQTFTRGRRVNFAHIPIFIEACDGETLAQVRELASALSSSVTELDSERRRRLHLSAVFVCNFVNAMFIAGEQLVGESGLEFSILKPLIEESCAKALLARSPKELQTGPAVRGDHTTMERHIEMLESDDLKEIYQKISTYIWETLKRI